MKRKFHVRFCRRAAPARGGLASDGCHDVGSATNVVRAVDELSRASWAWRVDGR